MDRFELLPDELCDSKRDWSVIHMVMSDWESTGSPLAHWHRKALDYRGGLGADLLPHAVLEQHLNGDVNLTYGLPTYEALHVCRFRVRYEVAKLTVEFAEPTLVEIQKDVRVNFSDQLGVVGELSRLAVSFRHVLLQQLSVF